MAIIIITVAVSFSAVILFSQSKEKDSGEVRIIKSEITSTARFYPVVIDNTRMEFFAVKASDGSIRTALNTCQICYSSDRGYYRQEGNELICENCQNRFPIDEIEKIKDGCNPVPILKANKTEDETRIVISKDFLTQNKDLFTYWKE